MPLDCGSTSVSTICTAIAASSALPPTLRIWYPASVASGLAAATMKCEAVTPAFAVQPEAPSGATGASDSGAVAAQPASASATAQRNNFIVLLVMASPGCQ